MMARIHLFPYPAPFPAWITAAEHYWALLPRAEGSRPDVRISSETRPDSFPSIYLEKRGPKSGTVFPSRFCREGAEGFLFSIPHPDEETVRHAGCEARQGIGAASSEPDYPAPVLPVAPIPGTKRLPSGHAGDQLSRRA